MLEGLSGGGVELQDVGRLTGLFPGGAGVLSVHQEMMAVVLNSLEVEHLRPAITTLVEVISWPLWPKTWQSLAGTGAWLGTVCPVEWRMVVKMRSTWKWLL